MPPPTLQVQDIVFRRGERTILKGITWTVQRGEHWAVLGPNGCGKTSLINIITGYDCATSGSISIDGARYGDDDWREVRKRVGLVTSALNMLLETAEPAVNVVASGRTAALNLWHDPSPKLCAEARKLMRQFNCGHLVASLWGTLSQGEKQKVLICRALMAKFRVLILDEPCAGLDPVARESFLQWLHELATRTNSPAIVMVTHHVEEILPSMDRVLILKDGQVLASGTTSDMLNTRLLGEAYGAPVRIEHRGQHYRLHVRW